MNQSTTTVSFNVSYDAQANLEMANRGTLLVKEGGGGFTFTGRSRSAFSRKEVTAEFAPEDIRNVVRTDCRVQFATNRGESGKRKKPFVFDCATLADAEAVVALLPKARDAEGEAEVQFAEKFAQLPLAGGPFGAVTPVLVGVNFAVFLGMALVLDAGWVDAKLAPYIRFGANNGGATTDGEWWRLLTSVFMHFGVVHLLLNMWALITVGPVMERLMGRALFLLLYLGAGLGGGLVSLMWNGDRVWSAGASGAVFGLYGALLGCSLRGKDSLPKTIFEPLTKSALVFVGYNLFYGLANAGIDNAAHVGGLLAGLVLGTLTALPIDRETRKTLVRGRLALGGAAVIAMVAAGVVAAPRYDYRIREEIAWSELIKGVGEQENGLVERQKQLTEALQKKPNAAKEYADWIEREFSPFYAGLAKRLSALSFDPQRATARRCEAMRQFSTLRAEAFLHLAVALRSDSEAEVEKFKAIEQEAQQALAKIKK